MDHIETFEHHRPMLFGIAYRMLGSVMEAEDAVQEAYLRFQNTPLDTVQSPKAFLNTVVTRLCMDQLKSARSQREEYYGPWLPEPLFTDSEATPLQHMTDLESISMAFLVLLEKLTPVERAVFLLREVFEYDYVEIARIVQKEEATCRKLFSRAKQHITASRPRFDATEEAHQEILEQFLTAVYSGDLDGLTQLLADDVVSWSDGGGKVHSATRPIYGALRVAQFYMGLATKDAGQTAVEIAQFNGKAAVVMRREGEVIGIVNFETDGKAVRAIHVVRNPDKLQHID